jgi:anti-sigma-K factor RskA
MKLDNPELKEMLAAEYALGTLHGRARQRFQRLLQTRADLRERVAACEDHLNPLGERFARVAPPREAWTAIRQEIGWRRKTVEPWWSRVAVWRALTLASSAMAMALFIYMGAMRDPAAPPDFIAVLTDANARPTVLVTATGAGEVRIEALGGTRVANDRSLELWLLPGGERPPVSLGLVPLERSLTVSLPENLRPAWTEGVALAVSLEPAGGSPTGQPTGPVLYQGRLLLRG